MKKGGLIAMNDRQEFLDQIRAIEFMILELNLYLDTHPHDIRALKEYNVHTQQLTALKSQYDKQYGPLSNFGTALNHGATWRWLEEPWPWEQDYWMEDARNVDL